MRMQVVRAVVWTAVVLTAGGVFADVPYRLGVSAASFSRVGLNTGLDICRRIHAAYLGHSADFLSHAANAKVIAKHKAKLESFGVAYDVTGPFETDSERTLRRQFEFAKRYGLRTVIGVPFEKLPDGSAVVPSEALLDVVEKLVKEFDVRYAIPNLGPDRWPLYPSATSVWMRVATRDSRIGLSLDVVQEMRAGFDPSESIRLFAPRLFDVQLGSAKADGAALVPTRATEGDVDAPAVLRALALAGYDGVVHVKYLCDPDDNLVGLAESMGYYLGCLRTLRVPQVRVAPAPGSEVGAEGVQKRLGGDALSADAP